MIEMKTRSTVKEHFGKEAILAHFVVNFIEIASFILFPQKPTLEPKSLFFLSPPPLLWWCIYLFLPFTSPLSWWCRHPFYRGGSSLSWWSIVQLSIFYTPLFVEHAQPLKEYWTYEMKLTIGTSIEGGVLHHQRGEVKYFVWYMHHYKRGGGFK